MTLLMIPLKTLLMTLFILMTLLMTILMTLLTTGRACCSSPSIIMQRTCRVVRPLPNQPRLLPQPSCGRCCIYVLVIWFRKGVGVRMRLSLLLLNCQYCITAVLLICCTVDTVRYSTVSCSYCLLNCTGTCCRAPLWMCHDRYT